MSGAPNGFLFPVSARGPKESKAPQKRSSKRKNREAPKFKKRGSKSGATNKFFCSFFRQGAPKSKVKKSYRGQKISKFAVIKLFNTKGLLKIPCK
jgi:hypothetical protein